MGTRLKIDALRDFVECICRKGKREKKAMITVWVNGEALTLEKAFKSLLDYR